MSTETCQYNLSTLGQCGEKENREKNRKDVEFMEKSTYTQTYNLHEQHSWLKKKKKEESYVHHNDLAENWRYRSQKSSQRKKKIQINFKVVTPKKKKKKRLYDFSTK